MEVSSRVDPDKLARSKPSPLTFCVEEGVSIAVCVEAESRPRATREPG